MRILKVYTLKSTNWHTHISKNTYVDCRPTEDQLLKRITHMAEDTTPLSLTIHMGYNKVLAEVGEAPWHL